MSTGKKPKGHSKDQHYAGYKNNGSAHKNKIRKLKAHLREFPMDEVAAQALKRIEAGAPTYRRKRPAKRVWRRSKGLMAYAHQLRLLGLKGDSVLHMAWNLGHPDRLSILPSERN